MTAVLLSAALLLAPLAPVEGPISLPGSDGLEGTFSQYGREPTIDMIYYHAMVTGKLEDPFAYDGFVAVEDCARVGQEALAVIDGYGMFRVWVFDCAARADGTKEWMAENMILGEIDHFLARRLGIPPGRGVTGSLYWLEERR
jgi:hypothetical protein